MSVTRSLSKTDFFSSRSTIGLSEDFGQACDLSGTMKL